MLQPSRREFLRASALLAGAALWPRAVSAAETAEPVIDVHGHLNYGRRSDDVFFSHQRALGVTRTVILPTGDRGRERPGDPADSEAARQLSLARPAEYLCFANGTPEGRQVIEKYLKLGAVGIGEQKFHVDCDSPHMERIAEIAREYDVPVLMHFQHDTYNKKIERFHRMLEKFPTVKFIGHAQAWWAAIDKNYEPSINYPTGPVTPGGITDRYLSDYPNCYAEVSAGSGNGAIVRDEEHYKGFMTRHQDKLLYGSDCTEGTGRAPICHAARTLAAIRKLSPSKAVERKILYENARKLLKLA